jgi:hypothetical protein
LGFDSILGFDQFDKNGAHLEARLTVFLRGFPGFEHPLSFSEPFYFSAKPYDDRERRVHVRHGFTARFEIAPGTIEYVLAHDALCAL